jgi:hypothetical protein
VLYIKAMATAGMLMLVVVGGGGSAGGAQFSSARNFGLLHTTLPIHVQLVQVQS